MMLALLFSSKLSNVSTFRISVEPYEKKQIVCQTGILIMVFFDDVIKKKKKAVRELLKHRIES